jgi:hypothetical protein
MMKPMGGDAALQKALYRSISSRALSKVINHINNRKIERATGRQRGSMRSREERGGTPARERGNTRESGRGTLINDNL